MYTIEARNVNDALVKGMNLLGTRGDWRPSRNGRVRVVPGPVTTTYLKPRERVLFSHKRDANPFFHFAESIWMMAGRNDVEMLAKFVKRMKTFSDDGKTFHGAYGHRWFYHFGMNQIERIVEMLKDNPDDRRCVLQMWDCTVDLGRQGKDVPCNTHIYLTRDKMGALDMTVCCRSNDAIWGAYGANVVHMSFLQECVAGFIGCKVGMYYQISNNFHAYEDVFTNLTMKKGPLWSDCQYTINSMEPYPIVDIALGREKWYEDLTTFLHTDNVAAFRHAFFAQVAIPIFRAHQAYREHRGLARYDVALEVVSQCRAEDWKMACSLWLERRRIRYVKAQDDGPNHEKE